MFYYPSSPVTLTHIALSLIKSKKKEFPIKSDETVTVLIPVYNEQKQFYETLDAVIKQSEAPKQIVISENGSRDDTPRIIRNFLEQNNYSLKGIDNKHKSVKIGIYENTHYPPVTLIEHKNQTSKAESMNIAKKYGFLMGDRTLTIDSDTTLDQKFIEEMNKSAYTLSINKDKIKIVKSNVIGATVLPKRNKKASLQEKIIAMGREAEYTFGQILVRNGQNYTALYVTPGCGFMCRTDDLYMPNKTVTEDLELTQAIQSNRRRRKLTKQDLKQFFNYNFRVDINDTLTKKLKKHYLSFFDKKKNYKMNPALDAFVKSFLDTKNEISEDKIKKLYVNYLKTRLVKRSKESVSHTNKKIFDVNSNYNSEAESKTIDRFFNENFQINEKEKLREDLCKVLNRYPSFKSYNKLEKKLKDIFNKYFEFKPKNGSISLAGIISTYNDIELIENNARYTPSAFMETQDPTSFRGLNIQLDRWTAGFHQVVWLKGLDFAKKNKKLAFTIGGALGEGLFSSSLFLGIPAATTLNIVTGHGLDPKYAILFYGFDAIIQSALTATAMYKRHRLKDNNGINALKKAVIDTAKYLPFSYILRFVNSIQFQKTFWRTLKEAGIYKKKSWKSKWIRPG